ncbi:MAG TPA: class I SAM-dependent methyltransferase [Caldilineaceae bacterium]|nr:class I SAM-dependent methyltransferase [Caldilineaceae bacterium]
MSSPPSSFRDLQTGDDVAAYAAGLDVRWPARAAVIDQIVTEVRALPFAALYLLELCCGPGALATALLRALPALRYVGIDASRAMLAYTQRSLARDAARLTLLHADLNRDEWLAHLAHLGEGGQFHALVSMQSLHDLGGEGEVSRVYKLAKGLLLPGGLFLNADLVVAPGEELADNPGRRSIARHLELLRQHGYQQVACRSETGGFGVVVGYAPLTNRGDA